MKVGRSGPRVPAHQLTTRHLGAAYPLLAGADLSHRGVLIGRHLLGGSFAYDPFELYADGTLSNPNMVVLGQIGRGKSAFVKTYLWRQAVFGRRAWVVDPKGEYGALAERWGVRPIALAPGGQVRLNPLDVAPEGGHSVLGGHVGPGDAARSLAPCARAGLVDGIAADREVAAPEEHVGEEASGRPVDGDRDPHGARQPAPAERRQLELSATLATAAIGRDLRPRERTAIELALRTLGSDPAGVTLPRLVERMLDPPPHVAEIVHTDRSALVEDGRDVALELRRLVHGDLRGMFDGPTTPGLELSGPLVVLDLSALYQSSALPVLMACATAWLQSAAVRRADHRGQRILLVVDEAWAILSRVAVARWLQASWKLSRARGIANVAVLHRVSDLTSVGAQGSEQVGLARGLLADSETRVVYAQPPGEADAAAAVLSLSDTERDLITRLHRGVALWKVANRPFLVQHVLGPGEWALIDTDRAMG